MHRSGVSIADFEQVNVGWVKFQYQEQIPS